MTFILIILDGFGSKSTKNFNAVFSAAPSNIDFLKKKFPSLELSCSGTTVGLPANQVGNSEVGHTTIGAGRVLKQSLQSISDAILSKQFFNNSVLLDLFANCLNQDRSLHLVGLISSGGVHSHLEHVLATMEFAINSGVRKIYLHAFLDGRDCAPFTAIKDIKRLNAFFKQHGCGQIASIAGRYYGMDRDLRWERTKFAYDAIFFGRGVASYNCPIAAVEAAYANNESDEFIVPRLILDDQEQPIALVDADSLMFVNFRADRMKQLGSAVLNKNFSEFPTRSVRLSKVVTLTDYGLDFPVDIVFPASSVNNTLGEVLAKNNKRQLRISETEKYAHVTFFFNCGLKKPFPKEDRILIPSPKVATYIDAPEMSSHQVTEKLVEAILSKQYDFIVCNYPNCDMVGHTGDFDAAVTACKAVDDSVGKVIEAVKKANATCIVTADHGNAEEMWDYVNKQPHTAHTSNHVPCIYVAPDAAKIMAANSGSIVDLAPTILKLMNLPIPQEMTGKVLFN